MQDATDMGLLRQYAERNSEAAFAALVARHLKMVYSAALRKTGSPNAAEEITQAVFIILARKAGGLRGKTILSGWLYQTARLTAANFLRTEIRRARREQEAYMQSLSNETEPEVWRQIMPLLEDAMGRLGEKDRNAVALRFFEGKSFQEIGTAFGASENAAKKRVAYALEKLRKYFSKRGVATSAAALAAMISANAVQATPAVLAKSVAAVAMTKGVAASGSTLTLIQGTLKLMAWTKAKTAIVVGAGILLAVGTTTPIIFRHQIEHEITLAHGRYDITRHIVEPVDLTGIIQSYGWSASDFDNSQYPAWWSAPRGFQVLAHVPLQIDGAMSLWGGRNAASGAVFPEQILGIPVNRKFETLYLYHGAFFPSANNTPVCDVVFRYDDGSSETNQLLYGADIVEWAAKGGANANTPKGPHLKTANDPTGPNSKAAWVGGTSVPGKNFPIRFCLTAINNPMPAETVTSIDLYSCRSQTAATIMAMTVGQSGLLK